MLSRVRVFFYCDQVGLLRPHLHIYAIVAVLPFFALENVSQQTEILDESRVEWLLFHPVHILRPDQAFYDPLEKGNVISFWNFSSLGPSVDFNSIFFSIDPSMESSCLFNISVS